jgi:NAD(P)-dependent dehydrogenase (short-subunit alcohol dehydrogenase family)
MLVTGASSGIGRACALHFHHRHWQVYGTSRSIQSAGSYPFAVLPMDVTSDASVAEGVRHIFEQEGRIDAVVNSAGISIVGSVEDTAISEARAQFETNFFGIVRICLSVLPIMRRQRSGFFVMIGSMAGRLAIPFQGHYSASKFALEGLAEALRMEVMPFGIHVALIEPGNFRTAITANRQRSAASSTHLPYRDGFERSLAVIEQAEINGADPVLVARQIERILSKPRPNLRYVVGYWSERLSVSLKKVLPYRLYEWLAMQILGLGAWR